MNTTSFIKVAPKSRLTLILVFVIVFLFTIILYVIYRNGTKKGEEKAKQEFVPVIEKNVTISITYARSLCSDVKKEFDAFTYSVRKEPIAAEIMRLNDDSIKYLNNVYNLEFKKTGDSFYEEIVNEWVKDKNVSSLVKKLESLGINK